MQATALFSAFLLASALWAEARPAPVFGALEAGSGQSVATACAVELLSAPPLRGLFPTPTDTVTRRSRIWNALGGAVLGASIGFFASQVATSDWDEKPGRAGGDRPAWAAVGGSVGLALGFSFPLFGRSPSQGAMGSLGPGSLPRTGPPPAGEPSPPLGTRYVISAQEIREAAITNALEAVRLLRPAWLIQRGQEAFVRPDTDNIRVYLDNLPLGDMESLRGVNAQIIESIRFFDATRATARWGAGHSHGVIQVITTG